MVTVPQEQCSLDAVAAAAAKLDHAVVRHPVEERLQRLGVVGAAGRIDRLGDDHDPTGRSRGCRAAPSHRASCAVGSSKVGAATTHLAVRAQIRRKNRYMPRRAARARLPPRRITRNDSRLASIGSIQSSWRRLNFYRDAEASKEAPAITSRADLEARVAELERVVATLTALRDENAGRSRATNAPIRSRSPGRCIREACGARGTRSAARRPTARSRYAPSCSSLRRVETRRGREPARPRLIPGRYAHPANGCNGRVSPRSSGDRASPSGGVCAGSNPAEGASRRVRFGLAPRSGRDRALQRVCGAPQRGAVGGTPPSTSRFRRLSASASTTAPPNATPAPSRRCRAAP